MSDVFTKTKRSEVMSLIRSRDTKPELAVRSILHRLGYRFRLHRADLPGRPDIVLPRYRIVIFVHGCFWHRHKGCRFAYTPKTRTKVWLNKFELNIKRDRKVKASLQKQGWRVLTVWECEIRTPSRLRKRLQSSLNGSEK